jgi:hypothetical protein
MKQDHITKEQFLIEFFGPLGRELGDPNQWFTDNPMDIFEHVEKCKQEKKPAFISVQPRFRHHSPKKKFGIYGIEKLFYDFDYGRKSDKLTERQIERHKLKMEKEIRIFINHLRKLRIIPLIVKTRKGYHFYVYFDSIYQIDDNESFWKKVYASLYMGLLSNKHDYKYADSTSKEDIARLCRIPTSIHQKSGEECIVLDMNLKPTKLRSIEFYKVNGLRRDDFIRAVERTRINEKKRKVIVKKLREERKEKRELSHGFTGQIRPCFERFMKAREAQHQVRLAMAIEAFYAGYKTREEMIEWFRWGRDWDGDKPQSKCRDQVNWFFDNQVDERGKGEAKCKVRPYKCDTIREFGWCIGEDCPIYRRQKESGKISKTTRKKT